MYKYLVQTMFAMLLLAFPVLTSFKGQDLKTGQLTDKVICIDAGHGGTGTTDLYRQGPTGEREEWVNLRVAVLVKDMLEKKGAKVVMTRVSDDFIPLAERSRIAKENKADLFLSIHHNATADPKVNFPIVYFHGGASENIAGVKFAKEIAKAMRTKFFGKKSPVSVVSDHTVFAVEGAAVLRGTYGIPGVLSEASFFTNPKEEGLLKDPAHNRKEAEAYVMAIEAFFSTPNDREIKDKNVTKVIPPFRGLQEADRMSEVAKKWLQDYKDGLKLVKSKDTAAARQAYDLFTRSARSFPDSYVAAKCHENRAVLLRKMNRDKEAEPEEWRVKEFYVGAQKEVRGHALKVMVISDLNASYGALSYSGDIAAVMKRIPEIKPDIILCGGDMVAGQKASLTAAHIDQMWGVFKESVLKPIKENNVPFGFTLGNHDASPGYAKDRAAAKKFWENEIRSTNLSFVDKTHYPFYFSYIKNNVFFLSWDAAAPEIKPEVMAWMKTQLGSKVAKRAGQRILLGHLPLYPIVADKNKPGEVNRDADGTLRFFKENGVDMYISGHQHAYFPAHKNGVQLFNAGCIGNGPRAIIGHSEAPKKAYSIIEIPASMDKGIHIETFMAGTGEVIALSSLPDSVTGFNGTIKRIDVKE